jgi:D-alanyl-lipoteichoic acid acyltransferase DltB (MBOAT superfamily)
LLFPTLTFAVFFTLVFGTTWSLRNHVLLRKLVLLGASYIFYGWWDWRFCFLLLGASLTAWFAGIGLSKFEADRERRIIVTISVSALLCVLAFFKYYGFFLSSLQDALFAIGWQRDLPFLQIILPVGISFFTFQAISYVVDVYRKDIATRRNPIDVLLYISLFPQLVAGPIVRAADFLPQLDRKSSLTKTAICFGLVLCVTGLFKKMVVANYLAVDLVDPIFLDPTSYSSLMLMLGVYGYAVQIYCDFSGYSDIAIGTAALLGFQFKKNFDQPYRASSLQDFWRRWHISLSGWLRDYLYIPLGGSKFGTWKTYRNLFLTMFLGGLWHGAAWTFIIWGALHGGWLALERALTKTNPAQGAKIKSVIGWLVTFHVVCAAWVFFRSSDLNIALDWFTGLGSFSTDSYGLTWFTLALIALPLAAQFLPSNTVERTVRIFEQKPLLIIAFAFILGLAAILWLAPPGTAPFIYFQF